MPTLDSLKKERERGIIEAKRFNKDQVTKFLTAFYAIEKDPYKPVMVEEVCPGLIDIRKEGQSLDERWPHFFICKLAPEEGYADYMPDSPLYMKELNEIVAMIKRVRAIGDKLNEEALKICEEQSAGRN